MKIYKVTRPLFTVAGLSLLMGCAAQQPSSEMGASVQEQVQALEARSEALEKREGELARKESDIAAMQRMGIAETDLLPVDAKAGECYARVWVEPQFKTVSQTLLAKEASEHVTIIPARYETVTEQVLVSDADYKIETVPATYKTHSEQKLVSPCLVSAVRTSDTFLSAIKGIF